MNSTSTLFLIETLLDPAAFDHPVDSLRLVETHISWVVLTGKYAYKIKKPVRFDFVDYSTLQRRRHFCELELQLNQRLAPDVYLQVVPITGTAEQPRIGGNGPAIEYAVKMFEFQQRDIFAQRIDQVGIAPAEIDQLATAIARFHQIARPLSMESPYGSPESVLLEAIKNFDAMRCPTEHDESALTPRQGKLLDQLHLWTIREFNRCRPIFEFRRDSGATRLCHGDMHLGNIVRIGDQVEIFDGIEFNPSLQWIDCFNELAFPMMDLVHHGRSDLAYRLLNVYLDETGDYGGLGVLQYYLVYRAMVRAKVEWLRRQQSAAPRSDLPQPPEKPFLDLAHELQRAATPFLFITHGLSGSGKTTRALGLAERHGAIRIRSDVERHRLYLGRDEKAIHQKYSREMNQAVYGHLLRLSSRILRYGFPVIVDATFLSRKSRRLFMKLADCVGVKFGIVDCQAPTEVLAERIRRRHGNASEATVDVLQQQIRSQQPLTEQEQTCRV